MKKENVLIVAVDFSKCSIKALDFAIRIANCIKSNILIVHVEKPNINDSVYSKNGHEYHKNVILKLEKLVEKFQPCLKKGILEYKIRKGKVHTEITNQAKYSDAYLIITGAHGISGFEEFWIGSNAFKVVISSTIPVITIREDLVSKKRQIFKIVLPIDSSPETRQKVPVAVELAKYFKAEIHVVGIYSTNVKAVRNFVEGFVEQAVEYIEKHGVVCKSQFKFCNNITDGIIEYAEEVNADLITIMSEQE
ncbi:MAG: universal stress protein, partial [Bacteroidetes bacterium]|nr:universal stress protein [Bacteroidota bacterium]